MPVAVASSEGLGGTVSIGYLYWRYSGGKHKLTCRPDSLVGAG